MKVQEHKITNKKVIQIYINEQEKGDVEIQKKIDNIKTKNSNVVIFVSGDNEPERVLGEMVKIMQNDLV